MIDVPSYRQYAADCVRQAQVEETIEDRNILLNVALAWLRLARQTEAAEPENMGFPENLGFPENMGFPDDSLAEALTGRRELAS